MTEFATFRAATRWYRTMPPKHTLNVSLTGPLRDFVDEQVQSGRFQTGSEVVRAALRMLQDGLKGPAKADGHEPVDGADGIGLAKTTATRAQLPPVKP
jgi:Arc/MetJ-type ribon-helix-helix transcriptional regulator